jgi:hypothetical protein
MKDLIVLYRYLRRECRYGFLRALRKTFIGG